MAAPALADASSCYEPIAPAPIDGSTATAEQMKAAHAEVADFIKASDDYQTCLMSDLAQQKEKRQNQGQEAARPLHRGRRESPDGKNQKVKEKVGAEYNTAVQAYKAKHP